MFSRSFITSSQVLQKRKTGLSLAVEDLRLAGRKRRFLSINFSEFIKKRTCQKLGSLSSLSLSVSLQCKWPLCRTADFLSAPPTTVCTSVLHTPQRLSFVHGNQRWWCLVGVGEGGVTEDEAPKSRKTNKKGPKKNKWVVLCAESDGWYPRDVFLLCFSFFCHIFIRF